MSTALERYVSEVVETDPGIAIHLTMENGERLTRRWAYQYLLSHQALTPERAAQALADERDQLISSWCAHYLARVADPTMVASMLESGSSETRLIALQHIADDSLDNAELERLLLDRSRRVREAAQWKAKRRGFDMASLYRARLALPHLSPREAAAAVAGIAATGSLVDAATLRRFLSDGTPAVRAEAVRGLTALTEFADSSDIYESVLFDKSPKVSRAAASAFVRTGSQPASLGAVWRSSQVWTRRSAWRIQRNSGRWDRVEADLRACADSEPQLAGLGESGIRNWLTNSAATTWGQPSGPQHDTIETLLTSSTLPDHIVRLVAFHCGIAVERLSRADPSTPPIIVNENGDITAFESVTAAESYLEAVDVLNNEYEAFDSTGRRMTLRADRATGEVFISLDRHARARPELLKQVLAEYLRRANLTDAHRAADASLVEAIEAIPLVTLTATRERPSLWKRMLGRQKAFDARGHNKQS
jgi:hypothetical protein